MTARRSYPDRDALQRAWLAAAKSWLGTPYRHQASKKAVGADCIGLITGVWAEVYGAVPTYERSYAKDWAEVGSDERLLSACQRYCSQGQKNAAPNVGDLLVFRLRADALAKHIALCSGEKRMLHAVERRSVSETDINAWWRRHIVGVFRPPLTFEM